MKVAIIHYHLNPGGVTRIIGSQVQSLAEFEDIEDIVVLCGNCNNQSSLHGVRIIADPVLDYSKPDETGTDYNKKASGIKEFIRQHTKGYILHFHNPNLGKNSALTLAVYQLASEGWPVVNHSHDFAEDRPENMEVLNRMTGTTGLRTSEILYPGLVGYHFVVLNSCDFERVMNSGIPAGRVHLIPNPVAMGKSGTPRNKGELRSRVLEKLNLDLRKKTCTYPVRGIKRKNLGEFILLAVLFKNTCQFVITQPPLNPVELPGYLQWKKFSDYHDIGIKFEAGEIIDHEDLIGISDFCLTTSWREGFGMVYLEPWLAGTPVSGRDLPCITGDLRKYGLEFPGLYDQISVRTSADARDFKDLEPEDQKMLIVRILESSREREKLIRMNPFLESLFDPVEDEIIHRNREIIRNQFSVPHYGKRLFALYKNILG